MKAAKIRDQSAVALKKGIYTNLVKRLQMVQKFEKRELRIKKVSPKISKMA